MKKLLAVFIIFIGFGVMFYPKAIQLYSSYMQEKLFNEWEKQTESTIVEESYIDLEKAFADLDDDTSSTEVEDSQQSSGKKLQPGMLGKIEIEKINLKLPILEGANAKNLKIAAGHMEGTAFLGQVGNSAIAAHRSRTYGKMFNRLNEIKVGDEIKVLDRQNQYTYKVYNISIVEPDDLSVLEGNGKDKILTLITCDPIDTGTHRLIIHAKLN